MSTILRAPAGVISKYDSLPPLPPHCCLSCPRWPCQAAAWEPRLNPTLMTLVDSSPLWGSHGSPDGVTVLSVVSVPAPVPRDHHPNLPTLTMWQISTAPTSRLIVSTRISSSWKQIPEWRLACKKFIRAYFGDQHLWKVKEGG